MYEPDYFEETIAYAKRNADDTCENIKIKRPYSFVKAANASFHKTELEKKMNENKIRIKYMPLMIDEDTKLLVFEMIRTALDIELELSNIYDCVRVNTWEGYDELLDIVVTFSNKDIRDMVYANKSRIEDIDYAMIMMCAELGAERAEIWRRAVQYFGDSRVYENYGAVVVIAWNNIHYRMLTLYQFERFMTREYSQKCNLYYLNPSVEISGCEEMLESPEPEVEKKTVVSRYRRIIRVR